jgi:hypothetical protein
LFAPSSGQRADHRESAAFKDGWAPLCEFLGKPVPNEPFPHLNEGMETIRKGNRRAALVTISRSLRARRIATDRRKS